MPAAASTSSSSLFSLSIESRNVWSSVKRRACAMQVWIVLLRSLLSIRKVLAAVGVSPVTYSLSLSNYPLGAGDEFLKAGARELRVQGTASSRNCLVSSSL